MAEIIKEELNLEEFEIKEEIVSFTEEILPSSFVKDSCTVTFTANLHKDDIKMEYRKLQGKLPSSTVEDTCTNNLL